MQPTTFLHFSDLHLNSESSNYYEGTLEGTFEGNKVFTCACDRVISYHTEFILLGRLIDRLLDQTPYRLTFRSAENYHKYVNDD